jgi:hypothetical protein
VRRRAPGPDAAEAATASCGMAFDGEAGGSIGPALCARTIHSDLFTCRPDAEPLQIVRVLSGYRRVATLLE